MVEEVAPRLRLTLHERYTRPDVYGLFGINYDARRTRHLNTGLSPALPDGGYFIFITLDKGTIAYDYEDELFRDQLIWVTRRDRGENDSDYVALRQPGTRVSLFARRADKERFAYLGEVRWTDHEQFSNEGRLQQRYVLKLRVPVPDGLLAELNGGETQRSDTPTQPDPRPAPGIGRPFRGRGLAGQLPWTTITGRFDTRWGRWSVKWSPPISTTRCVFERISRPRVSRPSGSGTSLTCVGSMEG